MSKVSRFDEPVIFKPFKLHEKWSFMKFHYKFFALGIYMFQVKLKFFVVNV